MLPANPVVASVRWGKKPRGHCRQLTLLLACFLVQGCVGIWTHRPITKTIEAPAIAEPASAVTVTGTAYPRGQKEVASKWLHEHWGKPARCERISESPREELWTYQFGWAWSGIVPCVVVPIPLVVPVGRQKVEFTVREERVVRAAVYRQGYSWSGAMLLSPEGPFVGSFGDTYE